MGDLAADAVLPRLRGRLGRPYTFVESTASTQALIAADATEGTLVAADVQTAGRGRLGRSWEAPAGTSLLFSVALTPAVPADRLPGLTLVAAHAVADALTAAGLEAAIKYPNDVLVRGRKVAGILGEARDGRVVLGIGVNVNVPAGGLPRQTQTPATSVLLERGERHDRGELLVNLLEALERRYDAWLAQPD
jgi:BirA family transcriptional regulator, biotin operon repressor / biotin---[acetyl-CoA-carboxylase] ligase